MDPRPEMKILFVNSVDQGGGAAAVARRLFERTVRDGHDSIFVAGWKHGKNARILPVHSRSLVGKVRNKLTTWVEEGTGYQYVLREGIRWFDRRGLLDDVDLVHLHNSHGEYLHFDFLAQVARKKPFVWTLHDEWGNTGHCAYTMDCERWREGCGECPYPGTYPKIHRDTTRVLWDRKRRNALLFRNKGHLVVPSRWLEERVRKGLLKDVPMSLIPNGVDTDIFHPREIKAVRQKLGIPQDRPVLLFAAHGGHANPFKGFGYLMEAIRVLRGDANSPFLVSIGNRESGDFSGMGMAGVAVGPIRDEATMADYFSAADCYLLPSVADNSPLVIFESLACGTPVAAFAVGGIPEAVREGETGTLAPAGDPKALADAVRRILRLDPERKERMRRTCMETVLGTQHDFEKHYAAYMDLYRKVVEGTLP